MLMPMYASRLLWHLTPFLIHPICEFRARLSPAAFEEKVA